jgi:hypothetical protein
MRLSLATCVATLGALCVGCLPIKYDFRAAPAVDGRLTRAGQPARADVHFGGADKSGRCSAPRAAVTDADGRFHIDARVERVYVAMVDRFPASTLCIQPPVGAAATWEFGVGNVTEAGLTASCELGLEAPGPTTPLTTLPPAAPPSEKGCRIAARPQAPPASR